MQELSPLVSHSGVAQFDPPARLRLVACVGAQWPAALVSRPVKSIDPARVLEKLSGSKRRPVWMGYISPVDLLIDQQPSQASELEQLLNAWLEHTAIFLQARELEPNDTRLIKLSHLDPGITGRPPATPAELPLPLQLYLQRRHDVLQRYADLEGQADLLGRQPEFTLPVARLSNSDWQALLLQAWETQALLPELQNKQEALQRTQTEALQQAEISGQEQGAKILALEAEAVQLRRARDEAADGREQQGRSVADLQQQLSSQAEALTEAREEADLTLLQLHQVQEELERYFLRSRAGDQLVAAQAEQNGRAFALLGRMLQLTTTSGPWRSEPQLAPPSSLSKRSRLRWAR